MSEFSERFRGTGRPLVIAHRGDWSGGPENSVSAIRAARAFDIVEIDVQLAADGVPVIMHDDSCLRTTGRDVLVKSLAAAEIAAIPFLESEECVPTLENALQAGGPGLLFDLDVKHPKELNSVGRFLSHHAARDRCMLKMDVTGPEDLTRLLALQAEADTSVIAKLLLRDPEDIDLVELCRDRGVTGAEVWFSDLSVLAVATKSGLPLSTYTLDEVHCDGLSDEKALNDPESVWGKLRTAGIRAIMTDHPAALLSFLDGKKNI